VIGATRRGAAAVSCVAHPNAGGVRRGLAARGALGARVPDGVPRALGPSP